MSISSRTNRKTLINPHTGLNNNKPVGILNLGEIGVQHSGVDSAKLYVETESASTSPNTIATFITEDETKQYVDGRISGVTEIIGDLVDIVLTGGTGDDIINVTINGTSADTNPNTFVVTHKSGSTENGFKKLETDSYGHVTAGTDVTIDDITDLSGFVETVEAIAESAVTTETERAMEVEETISGAVTTLANATEMELVRLDDRIDDAISALTLDLVETREELSGLTESGKTIDALLLKGIIWENEKVASAALTDLDYRVNLISASTPEIKDIDKLASAITINGVTKYVSNNTVDLGDFLSASTPYIKSITETTEQGTGNRVLTFTDSENNTTEIVETVIIDCGEY